MVKRSQMLLVVILISIVAVPAYAALYDASGRWLLETEPDQTISIGMFSLDVPDAWLWATVDQDDTMDTFSMVTDEIADLGGISYSGSGTISGSQYAFDSILTETVNLSTVPGYEAYPILFNVSLDGFELTSENDLEGIFQIGIPGAGPTIAFTGTKQVVPLPAAVWLMGSGVVALFGLRRRVSRKPR